MTRICASRTCIPSRGTWVRCAVFVGLFLVTIGWAQQSPPPAQEPALPVGLPPVSVGKGPFTYDTAEHFKIRVSVIARGLAHPWGIAFLPDGGILVTERPGRLRLIRNGVLQPEPIRGVPEVFSQRPDCPCLAGLMGIALHPQFADNKFVYLAYSKPVGNSEKGVNVATALARGRFDGSTLTDVRDLLVTNAVSVTPVGAASNIIFARNGFLYMTVGMGPGSQDLSSHFGKVLRLTDGGTVPPDNPFVGGPAGPPVRVGAKPEIYSYGHRNQIGLAINPDTGQIWESENGPNGGDEVNVLLPGRNYGWPTVSYGRNYNGIRVSEHAWQEGVEEPTLVWLPAIAISGMTFYTGDRFPAWRGNLFVGSLRTGEINGTGHLERIVFNSEWGELRRESLLTDLRQRIRNVQQGPDGSLYILTDGYYDTESANTENGLLLKIEPAQ
jgi:aldose sugar dehydrogenase